jgi:hypothetical protein
LHHIYILNNPPKETINIASYFNTVKHSFLFSWSSIDGAMYIVLLSRLFWSKTLNYFFPQLEHSKNIVYKTQIASHSMVV